MQTGVAGLDDIVGGSHCMTPRYLAHQSRSRSAIWTGDGGRLLRSQPRSQLQSIAREEFEGDCARPSSSWSASAGRAHRVLRRGDLERFRVAEGAHGYHALERMWELAREAGGDSHGFRFVQLPFNLAMPEALIFENQPHEARRHRSSKSPKRSA